MSNTHLRGLLKFVLGFEQRGEFNFLFLDLKREGILVVEKWEFLRGREKAVVGGLGRGFSNPRLSATEADAGGLGRGPVIPGSPPLQFHCSPCGGPRRFNARVGPARREV